MFDGYCRQIMQPKRVAYNKSDLECGYPRQDFQLQGLQCSLYKCNKYTQSCVLYLHGYNGSRLEAVQYASFVCKSDFDFCSFDFQAAGQSEGDFVTFGLKEEENVALVIRHLKEKYFHIILWGRSMGATTALMYTQKNQNIKCLVLDSPFLVLEDVVINLIKLKLHTPDIINKGLYELIRRSIAKLFQFQISKVQLPLHLNITCPMILLASKQDHLIPQYHFDSIYKGYVGNKRIVALQNNHNEQRSTDIIKTIIGFCQSMTPQSRFSPTKYPDRLLGDLDEQKYIATGIKIKQKIMRNQSASTHTKNSAQIQKDKALMQLSILK
ncbi:unnamed protein product (macronuclear) [Paramecium tetraurelia]|uniref:Serine aminopeptidase S33 domain-containing protein n=1 Tax=Paramecium tetraurelia TaxID=5888 RepID=A0EGA4_PARTE|nr:uncharacterized protein GSPATT00026669001 [Paramecium tetraurelia]CAK94345.1 unnamed protein product [Paramecium tetraurelia]|eukprot:XP_001461718.1 hypothetical protein (macronuclear) [Paramecium tetraurelia strain d4-2]